MSCAPRHRIRRGLTLIEVLTTITIISIVIPVAMHGLGIASGLASSARQRSEATVLAESKLNELVLSGEWQTAGLSGDFGEAWPAYKWEVQVTGWDEPNINQLQLQVTWDARGGQRQVLLSTLVYTPEATQ
jgi:general secretion pathway protein I